MNSLKPEHCGVLLRLPEFVKGVIIRPLSFEVLSSASENFVVMPICSFMLKDVTGRYM